MKKLLPFASREGREGRKVKYILRDLCGLCVMLQCFAGCATYNSVQVESGTNRTTRVTIRTFFDAKSELAKLSLSTSDKSQRLGLGAINQETTSSNLVNVIGAVAEGVAKGLKP